MIGGFENLKYEGSVRRRVALGNRRRTRVGEKELVAGCDLAGARGLAGLALGFCMVSFAVRAEWSRDPTLTIGRARGGGRTCLFELSLFLPRHPLLLTSTKCRGFSR